MEFASVTYEYPARNPGEETSLALNDVSLVIPEGKKVALVGFSGAGKTTMVDLIPRFIDPTKGVVTLGGVNLKDLSTRELRQSIAMVGQHTFLFNDTIYNNIAYGNPTATREQVIAAAKAAFAYDFVMSLPSGFESVVGEAGMTLSGGERQRLAIARAILKDAPILILDEATASLDNRAEREVQNAIQALERGRTTVVIAHRLSTVRDADIIVVMSGGRVVEKGTHEELLNRGGEYSRLHALQFREQATEPAASA
jgi:subfamily B ATP-binding cassette protein MsbA